jgi:predicted S18 family serine protease
MAADLKATGLQMVQDVKDSLDRIQEVAAMVKEGNAAILKDLEDVYTRIKSQSAPASAAPASAVPSQPAPVAPAQQ